MEEVVILKSKTSQKRVLILRPTISHFLNSLQNASLLLERLREEGKRDANEDEWREKHSDTLSYHGI